MKKKYKAPPPKTQTYTDLLWAYDHGEEGGEPGTPSQERFRKMYREDFSGFINLLAKHEQMNRAARQAQSVGPASPEPSLKDSNQLDRPTGEVDEGSERCLALVERLLVERAWEK